MSEPDHVVVASYFKDNDREKDNGERWGRLEELPNYQISTYGRIRNINTRLLIPSIDFYPRIDLTNKDGVQKSYYVHILVARTFLENPLNFPEVDHIDRNPENPRLDNLRWVDRLGNIRNRRPPQTTQGFTVIQLDKNKKEVASFSSLAVAQKTLGINRKTIKKGLEDGRLHKGFYFRQAFETDPLSFIEARFPPEFKHLNGLGLMVNREGVFRFPNGRLTKGSKDVHGYLLIQFQRNDGIRTHRVICTTFHGEPADPSMIPDHINEIKDDNHAENLEWVTPSENQRRSSVNKKKRRLEKGGRTGDHSTPVLQYSLLGKFIKEWPSVIEASRMLNINKGDISSCALGKKARAGKFMWRKKIFSLQGEYEAPKEIDAYVSSRSATKKRKVENSTDSV